MKSFLIVSAVGLLGLYIGAMLNMEGYLGNIFAIAAATAVIQKQLSKDDKQE